MRCLLCFPWYQVLSTCLSILPKRLFAGVVMAYDNLLTLPVVMLGSLIGLAIYRMFLDPLSKFPGPKLAAVTKWYEAYYEIVLNGQFSFHIEDLHRKYGPIVRITPFEVHIQDPPFWETLYVKHNKSHKYEVHPMRRNLSELSWLTITSGLQADLGTAAPCSRHLTLSCTKSEGFL